METVLKAIADWIKGILTAGIMSNLSGLFDDVNTQVGNIAQQVGTKPSSFEPRVFAMIEALSRNVVLPIAGIILTFIACYELIEMITQHNNMAQFEPALIMRWIFKTAVSVWLISNTFDIVMAVFDVTQKVVSDSSSIIAGNNRVNDIGLSMLQSTLPQFTAPKIWFRVCTDGLQVLNDKGEKTMEFFNSAIEVLQTLVIALGAGLGVWGAINLLEGYGNDNPRLQCSCTVKKQATENKR